MPDLNDAAQYSPAVHIDESREAMGAHAAAEIAQEIRARLARQAGVRMMFAAAPSQSDMLAALIRETGMGEKSIDWRRVTAFHMDEYIGLPEDAPQRFGLWLRNAIFDRLPFAAVHLIEPGDDPAAACAEYAAKLVAAPIDIVCCGIGTNGHLAFNDPPADFDDSARVKIVELDAECRRQQVDDGCFTKLSEVPRRAITVTIPGLLACGAIFCVVPGAQKKNAVRRALTELVNPMCPASALRLHPHCSIYLDRDSASDVRL